MAAKFVCNTPVVTIGGAAAHFMQTNAAVSDAGQLVAVTHTFSHNQLSGFHGSVYVALVDGNSVTIPGGASSVQTFGVDGTWIGNSDRTDTWSYQFPFNLFSQARNIIVVQQWNPQWLSSLANLGSVLSTLIQTVAQNGGQVNEGTDSGNGNGNGNGGGDSADIIKNHPAFTEGGTSFESLMPKAT